MDGQESTSTAGNLENIMQVIITMTVVWLHFLLFCSFLGLMDLKPTFGEVVFHCALFPSCAVCVFARTSL